MLSTRPLSCINKDLTRRRSLICYRLLHTRGNYYEYGDKVGRLLAHQLCSHAASRSISQIMQSSGVLTSDPVEINSTFKSFYSSLYTVGPPDNSGNVDHFFRNIDFPRIHPLLASELDSPITLDEIVRSINSLGVFRTRDVATNTKTSNHNSIAQRWEGPNIV
ncbi:hypothetical protein AMELA_G00289140 [Ameiurus melas]|uniref:Uncharacterized protein n=1 Tax=Ameiurus melas TaxID=219545 RepID=A0A7J5ZID9_AMEME|nr:hypothetical protein AMELA_G00289140 [Ameiurus melas]